MSYRILVVNPGSTSTKIGVYEDEQLLFDKTLRHSAEEIAQFNTIPAQKDWRRDLVMKALREQGFDARTLSAVSGRGGLLRPIRGGTYAVNDNMVKDCTIGVQGQHASNLGGLIAREIGDELGIPSYIVDPVVIDEMTDVARYAGHPLFQRVSIFHALNQKAVAKRFAKEQGKKYEDLNLIVCHMGGGVSIGAHMKGSVVDTQNALDGEGPFSPERSGSLPTGQLVKQCFSGKYTEGEMHRMLSGRGGLVAYTGSNDMRYLLAQAEMLELWPAWQTQGDWFPGGHVSGRVLCERNGTVQAAAFHTLKSGSQQVSDLFGTRQTQRITAGWSFPRGVESPRAYVFYDALRGQDGWVIESWANYVCQPAPVYPFRDAAALWPSYGSDAYSLRQTALQVFDG